MAVWGAEGEEFGYDFALGSFEDGVEGLVGGGMTVGELGVQGGVEGGGGEGGAEALEVVVGAVEFDGGVGVRGVGEG